MKTKRSGILRPLALLIPLALSACVIETPPEESPPASSFAFIQSRIFDQRCVQCHKQGEDFAAESDLLLTGDASYHALVAKGSKNEQANKEGLQRVFPGHPEKSFLYLKLLMAVNGDSGKGYGHAMPFGKDPLSNGHIEYIRQWIQAGAPEIGFVADAALMKDTVPGKIPAYQPLQPPKAGMGYQIAVNQFPVSPQFEREFFIYKALGNTEDVYVNRMQIKMRPGSHHFLLYMYDPENPLIDQVKPKPDVFRELRNLDGTMNIQNMTALGDFAFVVTGTQIPEDEFSLPAGVALRIPAGTYLDFNSHYVNYSDAVTFGEVAANLYTVNKTEVKYEARAINMANNSFKLPPNRTTVITTEFPVGEYIRKHGGAGAESMRIASMFSHTHRLAKDFLVLAKGGAHDGDTLYANKNWHHPPYKLFETPVTLAAGDVIVSQVTYENDTDVEVGFGFKSTDEMNIIFGYWY